MATRDVIEVHADAMRACDDVVHRLGGNWNAPTPCTEWTVRDLLNHLTGEQLWAPHLLRGATLDEVGDRFDGDVLGDDPVATWERAAAEAREAFAAPGATGGTVHVSAGTIDTVDYAWQMTCDLAVHGWDLAVAVGAPQPIPDRVAAELLEVFEPQVPRWQGIGIVAPPVPVDPGADAPTRLVALLGRRPTV
ncbi:TIGR03086 family metal-binding protein [Amycolatopsis suaedae]|uniref:TIGR03086 family protein n=1 Tax=Amycolatopsis suaedae TaxID=2510978 RepID=A0A4Q7J936_9PSEU|nr:TIGR03086 family metal-binding protein [Amycolatopsis suaedae]RZQ63729.1 TIGR03086 family protein [Amycolatopsis suaedae]